MALKEEHGLGNWEIATAKKLVSDYRRRHRILQRQEFDDLMQECLAHWIVARRRIPPEPDPRPPVSYMAQVLRNKLTDMVRETSADKRAGDPGALSLDASLDGTEDGITLGEVLADEQADPGGSGDMDSRNARIDLVRAMALLTPAQQRLCQLLGEHGLSMMSTPK
jgi:DNA-directed RNA polymerase specialized sigma24 family protein